MQKLTNSTIDCASKGAPDPPWLTMSSPTGAQASPGLSTMKIVFSGRVWKYSPSSTCHRGVTLVTLYLKYLPSSPGCHHSPARSAPARPHSHTASRDLNNKKHLLTTYIRKVSQKLFTLCHLKDVFVHGALVN